jgi:translation initiation factor 5B
MQPSNVKQSFQEKYLTLIGSLNTYGFEADLFYNITDFTKNIALVPTSARTKEGIPELVMMLCGLSQKYLSDKLKLGSDAKGVILEVKKDKSMNYAEAILYDGELKKTDEIAIANFDSEAEPIITKIRMLEEIMPLCAKFKPKEKVTASTGLRMQLIDKTEILPGMPFVLYKNNLKEIKETFKKEISGTIKTQKHGIIAKADSLGSLEALLFLLRENNIPVVKAGIGNIKKTDVISAKANIEINEIDAVVLGFNVETEEDAKELYKKEKIKIITDEVIYKLIENLVEFRKQKAQEIEKQRLMELTTIGKAKILHEYVFRNSNPAVFGIRIEAGKLKHGLNLIDNENNKIGRIKNIQSENKSVEEALEGMEVAISIPGVNFERQLKDKEFLYIDMGETQFKKFKSNKDLLTQNEIKALQNIAELKRKEKPDWGM